MTKCSLFEFERVQKPPTLSLPQFSVISIRNLALDWNHADAKVEPFILSGNGDVVASRYVGRFSYGAAQFEIKPRIGWARFGLMLEEVVSVALGGSGMFRPETARLQQGDILALIWCLTLLSAWRRSGGLAPKLFETLSAIDRTSLRGRLDVATQIKFNLVNKHHLACTWDEATIDNPINQGILTVIDHLRNDRRFPFQNQVNGQTTRFQRQLNEISSSLIAANVARPTHFPARKVRWSRANDRFRSVHRLGRTLLEQGRAAGPEGDDQDSLLLDSAEIWEMFLFHRLRRALTTKCSGLVLSWPRDEMADRRYMLEWNKQRGQLLIPDMIVKGSDGRCVAIIDAKYRHFVSPTQDRELACQMALYASIYTRREVPPVMVLVYPSIRRTRQEDRRDMNAETIAKIGTGSLNVGGTTVPLIAWALDLNCNNDPADFNTVIDKGIQKLIEQICGEAPQLRDRL
jgi:hypothetical protein